MRISGKVVLEAMGSGVWIIVAGDGKKYLPVNMPEQLKIEGEEVRIVAKRSPQESLFMIGMPIEITSFYTLPKFG